MAGLIRELFGGQIVHVEGGICVRQLNASTLIQLCSYGAAANLSKQSATVCPQLGSSSIEAAIDHVAQLGTSLAEREDKRCYLR